MTTEGGSGTYYCPGTDQITHFTSKGANLYVPRFLFLPPVSSLLYNHTE